MENTFPRRGSALGKFPIFVLLAAAICTFIPTPVHAAGRQMLHGHKPDAASRLTPVERLQGTQHLRLAIGLPLRNQKELTDLLKQISDPASPNYRHYLTPAQFAEKFGPTEQDYQSVIDFAKANGLAVGTRHPNRMLVDVDARVSDIEKTFHVKMQNYQHPKEARKFYAPDVEPSVDLAVSILHISGLDNYSIPHPNFKIKPANLPAKAMPNAGSALFGAYAGADFRAAYVPGTTLTGAGQSIGLLQYDGYYAYDITAYETEFGLPNVSLVNVPIDGGVSTPGANNLEVCLDIEMALSMAPGVSAIYVYEAPNASGLWVDILSRMANDNICKQLSSSWLGGGADATAEGIFQQMAAQGQSFFNASGDSDALDKLIPFPTDSPNITLVGGTTLTTTGPGGSYVSETVWNQADGTGSSGGISTYYPIPFWQQGTSMASNLGSTTMRNVPDVAMVGDNVHVNYNNGHSTTIDGTSCAAPLWAGFMALVNQRAVSNGQGTVGFINPALYTIGNDMIYTSTFHDTTTGNNSYFRNLSTYSAVVGYDLCTGWGTPAGSALIDALAGPADKLKVAPVTSFVTGGLAGGPFTPASSSYTLTNNSSSALAWTAGATQAWLTFSGTGGTIPAGGSVTVTASLNANALAAGSYSATILFSNTSTGVTQMRLVGLNVVTPAPPSIISPLNTTATLNTSSYYQIKASNFPTRYGATGLPSGWYVDTYTGLISGTPKQMGTFTLTISATNALGTGSAILTVTVQPVVAWGWDSSGQTEVPVDLNNVVAIAAGTYHSLALKADGTVKGWRQNYDDQSNPPAGLNSAVMIAAGGNNSMALKSDGTVAAWGDNSYGVTTVPIGLNNVVAIAQGVFHSLALKSDGTVVAWGRNNYGQTAVPAGLNNVVAIAAGSYHSLALKSDGTVVAWGDNTYFQTTVPAGLSNLAAIAAKDTDNIGLKSDGTVVVWGNVIQAHVPLGLSGVVAIAAGSGHFLALKSDGTVVGWEGNNIYGETTIPAGLNNVLAIAAGYSFSLALTGTGPSSSPPVIISTLKVLGGQNYFQYRIVAKNRPTSYNASGLPSGLSVNASTGLISGTLTQAGTFNITISASNVNGTDSAALVLIVLPSPPVITSALAASVDNGSTFRYQITATNNPTGYNATGLPSGLSVNTATGLISGAPTQTGVFNVNVSASNPVGTASVTLSITVRAIVPVIATNSFTMLCSFTGANGIYPYAGLIQGNDGNLYGTTANGGSSKNSGTIFKITPNGSLTTLSSFAGTDQVGPQAGLIQGSDGNFYGTTAYGGSSHIGAVFKMLSDGSLTTFCSFSGADGQWPSAGLIQGSDGNFYGMTSYGGSSNSGTVFKITPSGLLTTLCSFTGTNGTGPHAGLIQGSDGNFYGTTDGGGSGSFGTVFNITSSGSLTTLCSFNGANGSYPHAGLIQGSDGNFYGTTHNGGSSSSGTVFKMTPSGSLTTLCSFSGANGAYPDAGLIQGSDGNFYGTTGSGGSGNSGTVFKMTPTGSLTTLCSFTSANGAYPKAGLIQGSDGTLYGTTVNGGSNNTGTVFKITSLFVVGPIGTAFNYQITATNNPTSYGVSGLPAGLNVNTATGLISGTPTQAGTFNITLSASNTRGTGSAALTLIILPEPPAITSLTTANGTLGSAFSYQIAAAYSPTSYNATGLPSGLSVNILTGLISGMPTQTGIFNVTISATNPTGTSSATLAILIQNPFDVWKNKNFTASELADSSISADTATPAADGISNLMKYALNLDPKTNGVNGLPVATTMSINGSNYLTLAYTQVISATDIIYTVEVSGDLQVWSFGNGFTSPVSATNNPDGVTQTVVVQDLMPMNSTDKRFIRLKVTKP